MNLRDQINKQLEEIGEQISKSEIDWEYAFNLHLQKSVKCFFDKVASGTIPAHISMQQGKKIYKDNIEFYQPLVIISKEEWDYIYRNKGELRNFSSNCQMNYSFKMWHPLSAYEESENAYDSTGYFKYEIQLFKHEGDYCIYVQDPYMLSTYKKIESGIFNKKVKGFCVKNELTNYGKEFSNILCKEAEKQGAVIKLCTVLDQWQDAPSYWETPQKGRRLLFNVEIEL